jgi:formylglycine-generating enzyme required for sulfatase activity
VWLLFGAAALAGVALLGWHHARPPQRCPPGLVQLEARCCGEGQRLEEGRCRDAPLGCAERMRATPEGCVAMPQKVRIAAGILRLGPTDWEAQERVAPYVAEVAAFLIDSHEVTEAGWSRCVEEGACPALAQSGEPGLAQVNVTVAEAAGYCAQAGGSLPTRDQLAFAAMGIEGRRYPWGETGAVCWRASFGLEDGPCARAGGVELTGARPGGVTPDGVHDLAGNAAEWVAPAVGEEGRSLGGQARGGSWRDASATDLRTWAFVALDPASRFDAVGFRCAYPLRSRR